MTRIAVTPLLVALVASCGAASAPPPAERPGADYPLDAVVSVCDRFGHRVYRFSHPYQGGLAVVPNDPSCARSLR